MLQVLLACFSLSKEVKKCDSPFVPVPVVQQESGFVFALVSEFGKLQTAARVD
jgi:hypothetical protein